MANNSKKIMFGFVFFLVLLYNCFARDKAIVEKKDGAMFWEMTGTDKNGNESKVYILGTFHAGDDRLYPLPQFVLDAYDNADIVCGEISTQGWEELQSVLISKMASDMLDSESHLDQFLTEEEVALTYEYLGAQAPYMFLYKPWVLNQVISSFTLSETNMDFVDAYDSFFIARSNDRGINMEGLDSVERQIDCLSYGDFDFQLVALKGSFEAIENPEETVENFLNLYEAYLSFDEKVMEEAYFKEIETEINEYEGFKGYYDVLLVERNKDWAVTIDNYLNEGGTTFIFAGTGHFIGDDSVFNFMRANGTLK